MPGQSVKVKCPPYVYTRVATGVANALFIIDQQPGAQIALSVNEPNPYTEGLGLAAGAVVNLGTEYLTGTSLWYMPLGDDEHTFNGMIA